MADESNTSANSVAVPSNQLASPWQLRDVTSSDPLDRRNWRRALKDAADEIERLTRGRDEWAKLCRQAETALEQMIIERSEAIGWRDFSQGQLRIADSTIEHLLAALERHNNECQQLCGVGDQEAVSCQYRPYFENNGRRCPDCPVNWKIEIPGEALRPTGHTLQKPAESQGIPADETTGVEWAPANPDSDT